jgi:hypothetical protein
MNRRKAEILAGLCPQNSIHTYKVKRRGNFGRIVSTELHTYEVKRRGNSGRIVSTEPHSHRRTEEKRKFCQDYVLRTP